MNLLFTFFKCLVLKLHYLASVLSASLKHYSRPFSVLQWQNYHYTHYFTSHRSFTRWSASFFGPYKALNESDESAHRERFAHSGIKERYENEQNVDEMERPTETSVFRWKGNKKIYLWLVVALGIRSSNFILFDALIPHCFLWCCCCCCSLYLWHMNARIESNRSFKLIFLISFHSIRSFVYSFIWFVRIDGVANWLMLHI